MMQRSSYVEQIDPRLHIYPSLDADQLKQRLLETRDPQAVASIGSLLLDAMDTTSVVPILVLRGGLMLWQPCRDLNGAGPVGIIVPVRDQHDRTPRIAYASMPSVPEARYLLVDVLVASGRTIEACLRALNWRRAGVRVDVAAPFVSVHGRNHILTRFPISQIHCIWHAEQIDDRGRMIGPGFDIGDYALGWAGNHIIWAAERTVNA